MTRVVMHPGKMRVASKRLYTIRTHLRAVVTEIEPLVAAPMAEARGPALRSPPNLGAYFVERGELFHRLDALADGLLPSAQELRRRAGMIEESPALLAANLAKLTPAQRRYLLPAGLDAIRLKQKLAILAKALGITPPKGFNPLSPVTGEPARELLRMINLVLTGKAVGGFNEAIRKKLRAIQLPTSWQALTMYPGNGAGDQKLACWLAASARVAGIPPLLPVMCAIPESGIGNLGYGDRDSVGFFQIRATIHPAPAGFGAASGKIQSAQWWVQHPEAQMAWFVSEAKSAARGSPSRNVNTTDAGRLADWAYGVERCAAEYRHRYRDAYDRAKKLVDRCQQTASAGGGSAPGGNHGGGTYLYPRGDEAILLKHKLEILAKQHGVAIPRGFNPDSPMVGPAARAFIRRMQKELGIPQSGGFDIHVRRLLKPIDWVPPGSPYATRLQQVVAGELKYGSSHAWKYREFTHSSGAWCASFVSWALKKAGDPTPFASASVGVWVDAAHAGQHGLQIVSAADARPGDLVAYDWDGGADFYGRSHIGVITGGDNPSFETIHGNWGGTTAKSHLSIGDGMGTVDGDRGQVVFIRVNK